MQVSCSEFGHLREVICDETVALRFGCYDIFHEGHRQGLDFASTQADSLAVGIMPDQYVRALKGPGRPVNSIEKRIEVVDGLESVSYTFVTPLNPINLAYVIINKLRPDVYVEHSEHRGIGIVPKKTMLKLFGIEYVADTLPKVDSSSEIIRRKKLEVPSKEPITDSDNE